jgi:hypothetical protein
VKEPIMAFYQTTNGDYGQPWVSTDGQDPRKTTTKISTYREIADKDRSQHIGLKLLKTKVMHEKLIDDIEREAPDPVTYDPCLIKPHTHEYPSKAASMHYPQPSLKGHDSPIYQTANMEYGKEKPTQYELPPKYFPISDKFSTAFSAGRVPDTTLNTFPTPSRVHRLFDS